MINTTYKDERTEDGDIFRTVTVTVDTVKEAGEVTNYTLNGDKDAIWFGKGGKLVHTYSILIDATEMAIEKANDEWASRIAASEPDWAH